MAKKTCNKDGCNEPRYGKHSTCRPHFNEYQRNWERNRRAKKDKYDYKYKKEIITDLEFKHKDGYLLTITKIGDDGIKVELSFDAECGAIVLPIDKARELKEWL